MTDTPDGEDATKGPVVKLRVLETTDVHGHLCAFNFHTDQPVKTHGLTRLAPLIAQAREEAPNSLLFDNGDYLQGTPLSDLTPHAPNEWNDINPVIKAMNVLGYDAAGLGNHEFNFGLPWLQQAISQAMFPVSCANVFVQPSSDTGDCTTLLDPFLVLPRQVQDISGKSHSINIGVFSVVPPQVASWDQFHLAQLVWLRGIEETARDVVPKIRQAGADIVVALAHTGIEDTPSDPDCENAGRHLAQVPGIDVLLVGHSHQLFPDERFRQFPGADVDAGTLHGTPTVMAGFRGSHLGVVDLELVQKADTWTVLSARSHLRAVQPDVPEDPSLKRQLKAAHKATVELTRQPLGHSDVPLHSYLALVGQSASVQIVTQAQRLAVMSLMQCTLAADVPVLSASAPFKAGGRGGAQHYSDVPSGPLFLRHAADLYPFPNVPCVLQLSGAQVLEWLERAATVFNTLQPGASQLALIDANVPSHAFDMIEGLSYRIDLSQPPLFDPKGQPNPAAKGGRIRGLTHNGKPVEATDPFILVTNNYRAFGGGPYEAVQQDQILFAGKITIVDVLAEHMKTATPFQEHPAPIWQFEPMPNTHAIFDTGPGLRKYDHDIAALNLTDLGDTDDGFARYSIPLG